MDSKNIIFIQYLKTTIGEVIVGSFENKICLLDYRYRKMRPQVDKRIQTALNAVYFEKETPVLGTAKLQIKSYLKGSRTKFSLPTKMVGTPFQLSVWKALKTIPNRSLTPLQNQKKNNLNRQWFQVLFHCKSLLSPDKHPQ